MNAIIIAFLKLASFIFIICAVINYDKIIKRYEQNRLKKIMKIMNYDGSYNKRIEEMLKVKQ
jgi:hypothetical protein